MTRTRFIRIMAGAVGLAPAAATALIFNPPLNQGVNFPDTPVNEESRVQMTIFNNQNFQAVVTWQAPGGVFRIDPLQVAIGGGQQALVNFYFAPEEVRDYSAQVRGTARIADAIQILQTTLRGRGVEPEDPEIAVDPQAVQLVRRQPGQGDQAPVTVTNVGGGTLQWSLEITDGGEWFTVEPDAGELERDQSADLTVATVGEAPDSGLYQGEFVIRSNDPNQGEVTVEVELWVSYAPAPDAAIEPTEIALRVEAEDIPARAELWVRNRGERPLQFRMAEPEETEWLTADPTEGEAAPGQSARVTVEAVYAGYENGLYQAALVVQTNDPAAAEVRVPVTMEVAIPGNQPEWACQAPYAELRVTEPEVPAADTVTVLNRGRRTLRFEVDPGTVPEWLTVEPDRGEIDRESEQPIAFRSAAALPPNGEYADTVWFVTNDPINPRTAIEVRLVVDISWAATEPAPEEFALAGVYPNPFNAGFAVEVTMPRAGDVRWWLSDARGHICAQGTWSLRAGYNRLAATPEALPAGVYLIRLSWAGQTRTAKAVAVR